MPPCRNEAQAWEPLHPPLRTYIYIYIFILVYMNISRYIQTTTCHVSLAKVAFCSACAPCAQPQREASLSTCLSQTAKTRGCLVNMPFANRENAGLPCQRASCNPRKRGPALSTCLLQAAKTRACLETICVYVCSHKPGMHVEAPSKIAQVTVASEGSACDSPSKLVKWRFL